MERPSFVFHKEWLNQLAELPEDAQKHYALAIVKYALEGKEPEYSNPFEKAWFASIKSRIDADGEKYQERCERNRKNGSKSKGNPNFEKGKTNPYTSKEITHSVINDNPLGYEDNPVAKKDNPKAYDIDIDSDIDSDIDIDSDFVSEQKQTNKNNNKEIPSLSQIQEYIQSNCYASDPQSFYELNNKYNWAKVKKGEATWQELLDKFESNLPEEEREKAKREREQLEKYRGEYKGVLALIEGHGLKDVITIDFSIYVHIRKNDDYSCELRYLLKNLNLFEGVLSKGKEYTALRLCDSNAVSLVRNIKNKRLMLDQEIKGRGLTADLGKFIGTDEDLLNFLMWNYKDRGGDIEYIGEISQRVIEQHHNIANLDLCGFSTLYKQELQKYYREVREDKTLSLHSFSVIDIMKFIKETEELSDYVPDFEIAYNTRNYLKAVFAKDPKIFKDEAKWKKLIIDFVKG